MSDSTTSPQKSPNASGSSTPTPSTPPKPPDLPPKATQPSGKLAKPTVSTRSQIAAQPVPIEGFANPGHEWLTYETLFNHRTFRRSNQQRAMGLYRLPLSAVRIVLADALPDEKVELLRAAFFPDVPDVATLRRCANRPWSPGYSDADVRDAKKGTRSAVLPFNFRDNDSTTPSIGAATLTRHRTPDPAKPAVTVPRNPVRRLVATWPMWSTASRSCVVRVSPPGGQETAAQAAEPDRTGLLAGEILDWNWGSGEHLTARGDIDGPSALTVAEATAPGSGHFSLKSGVVYVGGSAQGSKSAGNKARLEANSILACLRSDHIAAVDRVMHPMPKGSTRPDELVLLPEVLTVTEDLGDQPGDGFQVRDITALRPDRVYFPALSIPYVGAGKDVPVDFDTVATRWAGVGVGTWGGFWSRAFAEPLGRAKAELLLRYGMQLATPNPQNFLIEFDRAMQPTGRMVIRDLGDALLHTQVIWAMFGTGDAPPASLKDATFAAPQPILDYERRTLSAFGHYPAETGGDRGQGPNPDEAYPANTQYHWAWYSALSKGSTIAQASATGTDPEAQDPQTWRESLVANAIWGEAHNEAYHRHLQDALKIPLPAPRMTRRPGRYQDENPADFARAEPLWREELDDERASAKALHAALISPEGLRALRAYQQSRRR